MQLKKKIFKKDLRPLNTCKKHFETILLNLPLDECVIQEKYKMV